METKSILESMKAIAEYMLDREREDYEKHKDEMPKECHILYDIEKVLEYANERLQLYKGPKA